MISIGHELRDFEKVQFGEKFCPWMIQARYFDGKWHPSALIRTSEINLSPAAKGLHYGLEIFEGMRAFRTPQGPVLFRPHLHFLRMSQSAEALGMTPYPEKDFLAALKELVRHCAEFLPSYPGSLYLRPFMMGTSSKLGVGVSDEILFLILATPFGVADLSKRSSEPKTATAWISPELVRAAPGGTGNLKVAGNYAASLRAIVQARKNRYDHALFLDAIEHRWIEEYSGMNFLCVDSGVLRTPPLTGTILPGITRNSLLHLAREESIRVDETRISVDELCEGLVSGRITEVLACGTGSAVLCISELGYREKRYCVGDGTPGPIARLLYRALEEVQFGKRAPRNVPGEPEETARWLIRCESAQ